MKEPDRTKCSSCGAPIYWARWRGPKGQGGFVPVDTEPDMRPLGGNLVLSINPDGKLFAENAGIQHRGTRKRYNHHGDTCAAKTGRAR